MLLLLGAAGPSGATKIGLPPCPSGKILASNSSGYAFQSRKRGFLYGCARGARYGHFFYTLARGGQGQEAPQNAFLSGPFIIFNKFGISHCTDYHVYVGDIRTGATFTNDLTLGTNSSIANGCTGVGRGELTAAVARRDGAVAFISGPGDPASYTPGEVYSTYEVALADWTGLRSVAIGKDIAPKRLTLAGDTVSWRQNGIDHSASFAPIRRRR